MTWRTAGTFLLPALALLLPFAATAQQSTSSSADPSQIQRRIEETKPVPAKPKPDVPSVPKEVLPKPVPSEERFILAAVTITGAAVFTPIDLAPLYEDYLAREIGLAEVEKILTGITKKYRDDGYFLSRALAPPQDIAGGILQVRVIEGFVDEVVFSGAEEKTASLERYKDKFTHERPMTLATLERYTLLINDLSGYTVEPSLKPIDEDAGSYKLTLELDLATVDATLLLNNRGTPEVGRLQGWAAAGANSLFGARERLQFGFFTVPDTPKELLYYELTYTQPLGSEGTTVSVLASLSNSDAGGDLASTDVESVSQQLSLSLSHPIIRSREENLWILGKVDFRDFREDTLGVRTTDDSLRTFMAQLSYTRQDSLNGTTSLMAAGTRGLGILGASSKNDSLLSRSDGEGEFTKVYGEITRYQGLSERTGVQISLAGQWTPDRLLSSEEFAIGGSRFGRGYDFAEITGENGFAASIEPWFGESLENEWLTHYQIYGFYDWGAVWNNFAGGSTSRDSIASTGGGMRFGLYAQTNASFEIALPLTRVVDSTGDKDVRAFFSLNKSF